MKTRFAQFMETKGAKVPTNDMGERVHNFLADVFTGQPAQERSWNHDLEMWKLKNAEDWKRYEDEKSWNSTGAQLKRWLAAGGTAAAFFAQNQAGSVQAPGAEGIPQGANTIGVGVTGIQQLASTMDTGMSAYWNMRKAKAEAEGKELENGKFIELTDTMIAEKRANIKLMEKQGKLTVSQAKQIDTLLPYLKGKSQAEIENIKQQTNLLIQQQRTQETQRWLMRKQGKKLDQDFTIGNWTIQKMQWEQLFRDTWGIDPSDNGIGALIKVLATGNGGKMLNGLFNTVLGTGEEAINIATRFPMFINPGAWAISKGSKFLYKGWKNVNKTNFADFKCPKNHAERHFLIFKLINLNKIERQVKMKGARGASPPEPP